MCLPVRFKHSWKWPGRWTFLSFRWSRQVLTWFNMGLIAAYSASRVKLSSFPSVPTSTVTPSSTWPWDLVGAHAGTRLMWPWREAAQAGRMEGRGKEVGGQSLKACAHWNRPPREKKQDCHSLSWLKMCPLSGWARVSPQLFINIL